MKLDKRVIPVIKTAIAALADKPRPDKYKMLKGEDAYGIRVGGYRIIYEIEDGKIIVTVVSVGRRKGIYKISGRRKMNY